jgi:DNA-binding NarL/FixJ family response regulator
VTTGAALDNGGGVKEEVTQMTILRRVLLVSDSSRTRSSLRVFLAAVPDLDVIDDVDGEEALEQVELAHPDVILLDPYLRSPGAAARLVGAIRMIRDAAPIVVLAPSLDGERLAHDACQAAALGVVAATNDVADIVKAIRSVTRLAYHVSGAIQLDQSATAAFNWPRAQSMSPSHVTRSTGTSACAVAS